jgi:hypothetical protein
LTKVNKYVIIKKDIRMKRSELSLKRELTKVEKLLRNKNNSAWTDAQITGAQQALAWALAMNAMSPSKCFSFRSDK